MYVKILFLFLLIYILYKNFYTEFLNNNLNDLIYIENFFNKDFENIVKLESKKLDPFLKSDLKHTVINRKHIEIPNNHIIYKIFYNKNTIDKLSKIIGIPIKSSLVVPMEYRSYEKDSYMVWHKDSILTNPPQIEVVYTIYNTSDSFTEWYNTKTINKIKTKPNSIIIVQGNGATHRVTKITNGKRTILKIVYELSI